MSIEMIKLPYEQNELEPYISKTTMHFHYDKHYNNYVQTANKLIVSTPYEDMSLHEIVVESSKKTDEASQKIFHNAGQAWNHEFLWQCMTPEATGKPSDKLAQVLKKTFGEINDFEKLFTESAASVFGSGWTWLTKSKSGNLSIISTNGADSPLIFDSEPLLCCDVWEHAYYLDCQNERAKYVQNFFKVVNWDFVEKNYGGSETSFSRAKDDLKESGFLN